MTPRRALALLVGGLTVAVIARSTVIPGDWHFAYNLCLLVYALALALAAGLSADELGCSPARARAGLALGGIAFALISAALVIAAVVGLLDDERTDVSAAEMLLRVFIVIPVGTVLVEELAFRGALYGLLDRVVTWRWAMAAGAALFGLWHIPPIADEGIGAIVGTFAATTAAGLVTIWLRRRSGSVVAPILAHLATNSVTFALSWAVTR